eukprot:jgi/Tetstr1/462295/TSEL_007313.t1
MPASDATQAQEHHHADEVKCGAANGQRGLGRISCGANSRAVPVRGLRHRVAGCEHCEWRRVGSSSPGCTRTRSSYSARPRPSEEKRGTDRKLVGERWWFQRLSLGGFMPGAAHRRRKGRRGKAAGRGGKPGGGREGGAGRRYSPREQETIEAVERLLSAETLDIVELRKCAAARGLVNRELRRRVWPILLEVDINHFDYSAYRAEATGEHRDSRVVEVDVIRSLWNFTQNWSDARRDGKRESLKRLLNGAVCSQEGVYYYQGLHDIASVLLLTLGEELAYAALRTLTTAHLRDFTRPNLEPVNEILRLLRPLLYMHDRELYRFIERCEELEQINMGMSRDERRLNRTPPYYAISWVITWFSHSIDSLAAACRLFDLFFSAHPLMPLYVAVVALAKYRKQILLCDVDDFPGVHTTLKNMDILSHATLDELCAGAAVLFQKYPPSIVRRAAKRDGVLISRSVTIALPDRTHGTIWDLPDKQQDILFSERLRSAVLAAIPDARTTVAALSILGLTALSMYQVALRKTH